MGISPHVLLLVASVNIALSNIPGTDVVDTEKLLAIQHKFDEVEKEIEVQLRLSPKRQAALDQNNKEEIEFKRDRLHREGDTIEEINENTDFGKLLYQGDILLTSDQANEIISGIQEEEGSGVNRTKRQAFRDHRYPYTIWREGVNYCFDHSINQQVRRAFKMGAKAWEKDTCIDFREDERARDKIVVFAHSGCWSYIGRLGYEQRLSLGQGCNTAAITAHEIGHALGLFHTQSRHDRDGFIIVNVHAIYPDWVRQFNKESTSTNDNYGIPYDYGSIMHYHATAASMTGHRTMVAKDPKYTQTLGSPFVSFYELLMLNKHYGCMKNCKRETSAQCAMGGFPHPRNCTKCICPSGYGGDLCDRRPPGCGETVKATRTTKLLKIKIGNKATHEREVFSKCNYWIKASEGSLVEVKIARISYGVAVDGCIYGGVELKTHVDQRLTGYRFCAPEDAGVTLVSNYHIVPIIAYSRVGETEIVIKYREVSGQQQVTKPPQIDIWGIDPKLTEKPTVKPPEKPKKPTSTKNDEKTDSKPKKNVCEDDKRCRILTALVKNFCDSIYPRQMKKKYCIKKCNYC